MFSLLVDNTIHLLDSRHGKFGAIERLNYARWRFASLIETNVF